MIGKDRYTTNKIRRKREENDSVILEIKKGLENIVTPWPKHKDFVQFYCILIIKKNYPKQKF